MKKLLPLLASLLCALLLAGCMSPRDRLALKTFSQGLEEAEEEKEYYSGNTETFTGKVLELKDSGALIELDENDPLRRYGETVFAYPESGISFENTAGLTYAFSCTAFDPEAMEARVIAFWMPSCELTDEEFLNKILSEEIAWEILREMSYEEFSESFEEKLAYPEYLPEGYKRHDTVYVNTEPQSGKLMLAMQLWYNTEDEVFFELTQDFFDFYPSEYSCERLPDHLVLTGFPHLGYYSINQGKFVGDVGVGMHMRVTMYPRAEFEEIFDSITIP